MELAGWLVEDPQNGEKGIVILPWNANDRSSSDWKIGFREKCFKVKYHGVEDDHGEYDYTY